MIEVVHIPVTTTGSAGSATGTGYSVGVAEGRIVQVVVDYHASAPATTDLTLKTKNAPAFTFLTLTDVNTDGTYVPRQVAQDAAGADVTFDGTNEIYVPYVVRDELQVDIAGADALTDCAIVYVYVERR